MAKESAGILVFRRNGGTVEVLLGHKGGPFWAKKDKGAWDIPKGLLDDGENHLAAAKREFEEEMGSPPPTGELIDLGSVKNKSGKTVFIWAVEGDFDAENIKSNTFELEWPPKSGNLHVIPEVDRAKWFPVAKAGVMLHAGYDEFVNRLAAKLDVELKANEAEQASLF